MTKSTHLPPRWRQTALGQLPPRQTLRSTSTCAKSRPGGDNPHPPSGEGQQRLLDGHFTAAAEQERCVGHTGHDLVVGSSGG